MRRLIVFFVLSAAIGCGLTFSPGDYGAPSESVDGGPTTAPETGPLVDAPSGPTTDTGPAPPSLQLLLFAGTKDTGGTNDVWLATVNEAGDLGPLGYLQSTPLPQPFQAFGRANGKLLTVVQGNKVRVVQSADFDGGITSGWATATVANAPTSGYGSFFAHASLVAVGGQTSEEVDDGAGGTTTVTTNHPELYVSMPAADGGYPAPNNVTSMTKLPAGVFNVTTVIYEDFVYLWGNGDKAAQGKTYVGKVDETAGLSSVTETTPIVAQGSTPTSAMACAGEGRLFVINGDASMSADITPSTGALGAWKTGAVLPSARTAAGCAVIKGWLYLFGGRLTSAKELTSEILRSKIGPDGTLAKWETTAQTLPGARANVFALTY
jgi:hypothetical protein